MAAIIGSGSHRYEVQEHWARLPEGMAFGYTHGIDTDSDGHVYIFHTGSPSVAVFDREGSFLRVGARNTRAEPTDFIFIKTKPEARLFI